MEENDASVKDMEIAAIAWAAEMFKTPHFGVKVVTDIVDGDSRRRTNSWKICNPLRRAYRRRFLR